MNEHDLHEYDRTTLEYLRAVGVDEPLVRRVAESLRDGARWEAAARRYSDRLIGAEELAPMPPETWEQVSCDGCDHFATLPHAEAVRWAFRHATETGHPTSTLAEASR